MFQSFLGFLGVFKETPFGRKKKRGFYETNETTKLKGGYFMD